MNYLEQARQAHRINDTMGLQPNTTQDGILCALISIAESLEKITSGHVEIEWTRDDGKPMFASIYFVEDK